MKILFFLISFLLPLSAYSAASTVVYPNFTGLSTDTISGVSTPVAKAGTVSGNIVTIPRAYKVPGVPTAAQEAISSAVTMRSPINQTLLKKALLGARVVGGLSLPVLALMGLEYAAGQWYSNQPDPLQPTTLKFIDGHYFYDPNLSTGACSSGGGLACVASSFGLPSTACNTFGVPQYQCSIGSSNPWAVQTQPISQTQAEAIVQASPISPTDADIQMMLDAGWGVPIQPNPEVVIDLSNLNSTALAELSSLGYFQPTPKSIALKNGQPVLDPLTGQNKQPMLQIDPAPNAGVRLTPYDAPVDAAGNPQTDVQGNPLPNQKSEADPCELNPERAGCSTLGTPDETVPTPIARTIDANFNAFNISGQCPADKTFTAGGITQTIHMAPICSAATDYIKPFMLLMASITAYFIFVGGLRT